MFGANDLLTIRTESLIEQSFDEENFIKLSNYEFTHKDGGTLDMHLANSKLTSVFDNLNFFTESPSDHYPTLSTYNIDKPIQSHWEKMNEKSTKHISHNLDYLDRNKTNKTDLERHIDKITQKSQSTHKEGIFLKKHIAKNHQIKSYL